jgi:virginiamycin A acetyltransferase
MPSFTKPSIVLRLKYALIGDEQKGVKIKRGFLMGLPLLEVGRYTRANRNLKVKGVIPCRIGRYVAIGENVTIITSNHRIDRIELSKNLLDRTVGAGNSVIGEEVVIENNVWIGDNTLILPGVRIGEGAIIAAGSIVSKSVEPYSIVAGVPAREKSRRFSEAKRNRLLALDIFSKDLDDCIATLETENKD